MSSLINRHLLEGGNNMWASWLNRLGIIFNFFAGFLLAPDLIGRERLRRFESWLEEKARSGQYVANYLAARHKYLVILTGLIMLPLVIFMVVARLDMPSEALSWVPDFVLFRYLSVVMGMMAIFIVLIVVMQLIVRPWLTFKFLGRLLDRLDGDDRLTTYLVVIGIVLFVTGNMLQFISTFLPSSETPIFWPPTPPTPPYF